VSAGGYVFMPFQLLFSQHVNRERSRGFDPSLTADVEFGARDG